MRSAKKPARVRRRTPGQAPRQAPGQALGQDARALPRNDRPALLPGDPASWGLLLALTPSLRGTPQEVYGGPAA